MKTFACVRAFCIILLGSLFGCAGHNVKYQSYVKQRIPATDRAVLISGSFDEAKAYFEKAQLPHNSPRDKFELACRGLEKLTDQLGSPDYVLIGEVFGGGNAWANQNTLSQALCKKAAKQGGDVVMIFQRATVEQPFVYSTPGYSSTHSTANAYGYGNHATAYGTSHTTYTPAQTYSGVMRKPQANGLVFKHLPGIDIERRRLLQTDDQSLAKALEALEVLSDDRELSWDEAKSRWLEIAEGAHQ